eukprot:gene17313-biopygen17323
MGDAAKPHCISPPPTRFVIPPGGKQRTHRTCPPHHFPVAWDAPAAVALPSNVSLTVASPTAARARWGSGLAGGGH